MCQVGRDSKDNMRAQHVDQKLDKTNEDSLCLQCPCYYSCTSMRFIWINTSNKSKISNLWRKSLIKKNVAAFYVSVDNFLSTTSMKICEAFCYSGDDIKPLLPT